VTRYSRTQIATVLSLVDQGRSLRQAGAAVGASHPTVLRGVRHAA
jgi:transposase-like protein